MLRAHRELWPWALLPFAINVAMFGLAAWLFLTNLDAMGDLLTRWIPRLTADAWWEWIWVGPLKLVGGAVRVLLLLVFAALVYFAFTVIGGVIAAPFLELLSERVEQIASGSVVASDAHWFTGAWRSILDDARRVAFFLLCALAIAAVGLVPGMQPIAFLGEVVLAALFLALDYTAPVLGRRELRFQVRRAWLWQHRGSMLGFGLAGLGTLCVPGLNFACLPWLVTSGTLLALDLGVPAQRSSATPRVSGSA